MTTYDFTTLPNRLSEHSEKWHEVEDDADLLPLWVADMDFEPLPAVREAVKSYAEQVYGYSYPSAGLFQAILDWERTQHGLSNLTAADIALVEGVVPAISIAVQAFTEPGDAVLINTPVYPPFARTVKLNARDLVCNSLVEEAGEFVVKFDSFEKAITEHQVKLFILCNPHNPGGRVWRKDELEQMADICARHGVLIVSDEIHQDLTLFGNSHTSFLSLSPDIAKSAIVLASATKTFNIAGTKCSYALIPDTTLREKFLARRLANNQHEVASLGMLTTEAALRNGADWLTQLKETLETNINYLLSNLTAHTKIKAMRPEATYLVWLDFSSYELTDKALDERLRNVAHLILNRGKTFGNEGTSHARFNAAAPFTVIEEATKRLVTAFKA
ncbi:MAG: pyridoxal phosphate-dependent aminotransferase [Streptococcaceae bacterium]|jgi:cystathionine beta-lyase|nr:pyridoxal phosphate-dependent aminotransferase [Streptococcaceae bacterium]